MRPRRVLVVHREAIVADAITSALAAFDQILPLRPATSAAEAEDRVARTGEVDAVAVGEGISGEDGLVARLRRRGARVVVIGDASVEEGEEVRVSTAAPVAALAAALVPALPARRPMVLSAQQSRVLSLVARGLTAKQVARQLRISPKTVEQHKTRIFERLGVPNQAAAVRAAFGPGAAPPGPWSAP